MPHTFRELYSRDSIVTVDRARRNVYQKGLVLRGLEILARTLQRELPCPYSSLSRFFSCSNIKGSAIYRVTRKQLTWSIVRIESTVSCSHLPMSQPTLHTTRGILLYPLQISAIKSGVNSCDYSNNIRGKQNKVYDIGTMLMNTKPRPYERANVGKDTLVRDHCYQIYRIILIYIIHDGTTVFREGLNVRPIFLESRFVYWPIFFPTSRWKAKTKLQSPLSD